MFKQVKGFKSKNSLSKIIIKLLSADKNFYQKFLIKYLTRVVISCTGFVLGEIYCFSVEKKSYLSLHLENIRNINFIKYFNKKSCL